MEKTKLTTQDIQTILKQKGNVLLENLDFLEEIDGKIAFESFRRNNTVLIKNCKKLKSVLLDISEAHNIAVENCPSLEKISINLSGCTVNMLVKNCHSLSTFNGNMSVDEVTIYACNNLKTISQKICVRGDLQISNCKQLESFSSIFVGKECFILYCPSLVSLGEQVQVGETLHILNCKNLKKLPKNMIVGGLSLAYCPSLEAIPQSLSIVNGQFSIIDCAALKELPKNLIVGGNLFIRNCPNVRELPEKLYCGYNLKLDVTGIKALPADLIVGDSIIGSQKLETIPDTIKVGGKLFDKDCPQYGFSQNEYYENRYFYLSAEKRLLLIDSTQQQDGYTMLSFINDTERIVAFDDEHFFVHSLEDGRLSAEKFEEIIEKILQSGLNTIY